MKKKYEIINGRNNKWQIYEVHSYVSPRLRNMGWNYKRRIREKSKVIIWNT
jgi:hypothetical protein